MAGTPAASTAPGGLIQIERGEVCGVPAFWPAGAGEPHRVALGFRVGYADETLPEHGITHLVEHLALFALGRRLYDTNGIVDGTSTIFYADGRPEELAEFLRDISAALHDLPHERLDAEKRVLLAESAGRSSTFTERLKWLRCGETSHGLADVKELGLRRVTARHVDAWAATWFTAGNAARGRPGLLAVTSQQVVHLDPSADPEEGGTRTRSQLSALAAVEAKDDRLLLRMQEGDEWSVSDISPSGRALEVAEEIERLRAGG